MSKVVWRMQGGTSPTDAEVGDQLDCGWTVFTRGEKGWVWGFDPKAIAGNPVFDSVIASDSERPDVLGPVAWVGETIPPVGGQGMRDSVDVLFLSPFAQEVAR